MTWKVKCGLVTLIFVFAGLLVFGIPYLAYYETYHCEALNTVSTVYPGDPVLAAEIDRNCQIGGELAPDPDKSPVNIVNAYITNCDELIIYNESITTSSPPYLDIKSAIVAIDQFDKTGSNYYLQDTAGKITASIAVQSDTKAYVCLFSNISSFRTFKAPPDKKHFLYSIKFAKQCTIEDIPSNTTHTVEMSFIADDTGYYFVAISLSPFTPSSMLQFNLTVSRRFYKLSNFVNDTLSCPLTTAHECPLNNTFPRTCVMLYATLNEDNSNDFNDIDIIAFKIPYYHSPSFRPIIIPFSTISLLTVLCIVVQYCWYCLYMYKWKKSATHEYAPVDSI